MTDSRAPGDALTGAMRRRLWLARLTLLWERLWPALWPAVGVGGVFAAISLFDLWRLAPGWLHAVLLIAFAGAVALALVRGVRRVALPDETAGIRRIERASGLAHRPLETLRDRPAAPGDTLAQGLWQLHRERVARAAGRLRVGLAAPGMARHDPWALRAALLLILVVAVVAAGGDGGKRLARAFQPSFGQAAIPAELTLWLTPPDYTGAAPIFLAAGLTPGGSPHAGEVTVPSGSGVLARVHGGRGTPILLIDGAQTPFTKVDATNFEIDATLGLGRRLAVVQDGRELAAWPLSVIVDQPPIIEFAAPPGRSQRGALRLDYLAEDDYGLESVAATVRLRDDPDQSFDLELALPAGGSRAVDDTGFHDLTPHPWAGIPVTIQLVAIDGLEQVGLSDPVPTVLPERVFNHPVARRLIEERKKLALDPSSRGEVGEALDEVSQRPDHFFEDLDVFLGLRVARFRLAFSEAESAVAEVMDLLWDLALTIEDGPIALAEQALREAQQALLQALADGAPDEDVERLIDELLDRLDQFLDALIEQAQANSDTASSLEEQMLETIERDQLRQIVEQIRELARSGSRDAAMELLSRLQMALENLRMANQMGMEPGEMSAGESMLRDLEDLINQQQELLDRTFQWSQGRPDEDQQGLQAMTSGQQQGLRDRLGELMRRWGETGAETPRSLGRAERSMDDAARALGQGLPRQAISPQTDAIDELQQGARSILDSLLEQLGRAPPRPGQMMGPLGNQLDPLGRSLYGRGFQDDGRTRIPTEADLQRSREILDELYRRAGEFTRPRVERDYINRLLRRF